MTFSIDRDPKKSRWDISQFFKWENGYDALDSKFIDGIRELNIGGVFTVTSEVGRPDLLSYRIYGDSGMWWILTIYNSIEDPQSISSGMQIKYPHKGSIESLLVSLK